MWLVLGKLNPVSRLGSLEAPARMTLVVRAGFLFGLYPVVNFGIGKARAKGAMPKSTMGFTFFQSFVNVSPFVNELFGLFFIP